MWYWVACSLCAQEPGARFGTTVVIPDGLRGQIYYIKPNSEQLPDFRKLKPVGTIYTTSLNVPPQQFDLGFPGVTDRFEWFAIDYTGRIWIEKPGSYHFSLLSDDGSKLYLDDRRIIDNDGVHPPERRDGIARLTTGIHRIEVAYFQGPGQAIALVLEVAPPGGPMRIFNVDEFKPPPGADIPVDLPLNDSGKKRK